MVRAHGFEFEGAIYHLTARGNRRERIFAGGAGIWLGRAQCRFVGGVAALRFDVAGDRHNFRRDGLRGGGPANQAFGTQQIAAEGSEKTVATMSKYLDATPFFPTFAFSAFDQSV